MSEFKKIGIVGIGLIGGSIAKTLKKKNAKIEIFGLSRRKSTLVKAKKQEIIDKYFLKFENLVENTDFLILCVPLTKIEYYFRLLKETKKVITVTDVGSVKKEIVDKAKKILGKNFPFVGSHPMAGSEDTGLDASSEKLFEGKNVIITPTEYSDESVVEKIKNFWEFLGTKTIFLSPEIHDRMVSLTSHFPHLLVFLLLKMVSNNKQRNILEKCIGPGFIDTTRIGKSNLEMWSEIFFLNRENLLKNIYQFKEELGKVEKIIKERDTGKIIKYFKQSQEWRKKIEKTGYNKKK